MSDRQVKRARRLFRTSPTLRRSYPNFRAYWRQLKLHGTVLLLAPRNNPQGRPWLAMRSALPDIDRERGRYDRPAR